MKITVEKITVTTTDSDKPTTKWIGRVDGRQVCYANTKADALKWTQEQADWLSKRGSYI